MKKILVAVDGSQPSQRAALRAAEMAPRLGLGLMLAHVVPDKSYFAEWQIGGDESELHRLHEQEAQSLLRKVASALPIAAEQVLLTGTPAEAIAEAAKAADVELVALGSRGRTLLGGVLIGSVAHRLVHICNKPTLIVH
jgi:nucleotide-binding universal stress UspA family protein